MLAIINFNKECAAWTKNGACNKAFVECNINYVYEKLKHEGYVYLNDMYEIFGALWNPDEYNYCFKRGGQEPRFSYQCINDVDFKICIIW